MAVGSGVGLAVGSNATVDRGTMVAAGLRVAVGFGVAVGCGVGAGVAVGCGVAVGAGCWVAAGRALTVSEEGPLTRCSTLSESRMTPEKVYDPSWPGAVAVYVK